MNKIQGENLTRRGAGRPSGSPNRTTSLLRDAILKAAEAAGEDGLGKNGLTGYCAFLAKEEPRAFTSLLSKVLPTQISAELHHSHITREQRDAAVAAALRADS